MLSSLATFCGHVLWFLSCAPGWLRFQRALRQPQSAQEALLRRLLRENQATEFGRKHGFAEIRDPAAFRAGVPLADYADFADGIAAAQSGDVFPFAAERPGLLEPTSGTSGAPKLIPLNRSLRREFAAAVEPWIFWLYLAHPGLFFGKQYWAISPNTPVRHGGAVGEGAIRVGFSQDADYLGVTGRLIARQVLSHPSELSEVQDPAAFAQLSVLFLLRERNLRLISVWHPSFLTVLLDSLAQHWPAAVQALRSGRLPSSHGVPPELHARLSRRFRGCPARADELEQLDLPAHPENLARLWPHLRVISCWAGSRCEPWLSRLRAQLPQATIQAKGLLATEGCVTLPTGCGRRHPCAIRSHYLEFIERDTGTVRPLWELTQGGTYSVVLTTSGGLWRYRLHDRVRVTGFCHAAPCLDFVGKDDATSDLVGEKLAETHATEALALAAARSGVQPRFAMIVPRAVDPLRVAPGYLLLIEWFDSPGGRRETPRVWAELVEEELRRNYHYEHARQLGQLAPLQSVQIVGGLQLYRAAREAMGARAGTIKIPALEKGCGIAAEWWASGVIRDGSDRGGHDACRVTDGATN